MREIEVIGKRDAGGTPRRDDELGRVYTAIGYLHSDPDQALTTSWIFVPERVFAGSPEAVVKEIHEVVLRHIGVSHDDYQFELLIPGKISVAASWASIIEYVRREEVQRVGPPQQRIAAG